MSYVYCKNKGEDSKEGSCLNSGYNYVINRNSSYAYSDDKTNFPEHASYMLCPLDYNSCNTQVQHLDQVGQTVYFGSNMFESAYA